MKIFLSLAAAIVAFLVLVFGMGWLVEGNNFFLYRAFAPKYEQARREVFEQSKAYNQGMVQEIQNFQFQYEQADEVHREALRSIILHRVADFDADRLPPDLRRFVNDLRSVSR